LILPALKYEQVQGRASRSRSSVEVETLQLGHQNLVAYNIFLMHVNNI